MAAGCDLDPTSTRSGRGPCKQSESLSRSEAKNANDPSSPAHFPLYAFLQMKNIAVPGCVPPYYCRPLIPLSHSQCDMKSSCFCQIQKIVTYHPESWVMHEAAIVRYLSTAAGPLLSGQPHP